MAGGRFDRRIGKVLPGNYINFEGTNQEILSPASRGTVIVPLIGHDYGPEKEFIVIDNSAPDAAYSKLGYSIYDSDPNDSMLLIREAFKRSKTIKLYIPKSGTQAAGTGGGAQAKAKHGGTRGDKLSYAVIANPASGKLDVNIFLDGAHVESLEGITTVEELIVLNSEYITFEGTGPLTPAAGVKLTGGANATTANKDISDFVDAVEGVSFNTLCFPVEESTLKAAVVSKIKYLRDDVGKTVKAVVPQYDADYEGIINVTNAVVVDGKRLSIAQTCAWVAGADAGATMLQSNTATVYEGATAIVEPKGNEAAKAAVKNGEFFFAYSEKGAVTVTYDINSLVTYGDKKNKQYTKNKVIRVFDSFAESIQLNFPPGKYDNFGKGWEVMDGVGKTILKQYDDEGAIKDVDYDTDFKVDRTISKGDETYFNVGLAAGDKSEKLYFSIATR